MKQIVLVCILIFSVYTACSQSADLTVITQSSKNAGGSIKIGVFNSEESFKTKTKPIADAVLKHTDSTSLHTFRNLNCNTLAIAVYHDENSDDTLNTKKLGIPIEGVGFSGIKQNKLGKPKFRDVSFVLKKDTTITIRLTYPRE